MSEAKVRVRVAHNAMHLPVVALRGLVVFPNNVVHFEVGRQKSIAAIEAAMHANSAKGYGDRGAHGPGSVCLWRHFGN